MTSDQNNARPFIVRSKHDKEHPYVIISRKLFHDKNLAAEEKGVMAYLLTLPSDWCLSLMHLGNEMNISRDRIRKIINHLISLGYCQKTSERQSGKFSDTFYEISDDTIFKKCLPQPENQAPVNSAPDGTALLNKYNTNLSLKRKKEKNKEVSASSAVAFSSFESPSSVEEIASQPNDAYQSSTSEQNSSPEHNITYISSGGKSEQNKLKNNNLQTKQIYNPPDNKKIGRKHNVETTEEQHDSLVKLHGLELVSRAYDMLSEWKEDKTPKEISKASDYGRIKKWVINAVKEADLKDRELKAREQRLSDLSKPKEKDPTWEYKNKNELLVNQLKDKYPKQMQAISVRGNYVVNSDNPNKEVFLKMEPTAFEKAFSHLIGGTIRDE